MGSGQVNVDSPTNHRNSVENFMATNLRAILPVGLTALGKHDHLRDTRRGRIALYCDG